MERQKKNSGITLVALVISIVVMLILSGVSINAVVGENGVISQAQNAAIAAEDAAFNEDAEMILLQAYQMKMDGATDEEIESYLKSAFEDLGYGSVTVGKSGDSWLIVCGSRLVSSKLDGKTANNSVSKENVGTSSQWTVLYDENGYLTIIGCAQSTGDLEIPQYIVYETAEGAEYVGQVKQIGESGYNVFSYRMGLTSITIPEGVEVIYSNAFYECTGLSCEINFPSTLTTIGDYAFYNCSGLTGNIISKLENSNITSVGSYAFYGCSGLTGEMKLFSSISLGAMTFAACEQITGDINILLSDGLTEIPDGAFSGMSGLSGTPTIPSTVAKIGSYAFYNCTGLTGTLTIPSACTEIGDYAFYSCTGFNLLSIDTSDSGELESIGSYCFAYCTKLSNVNLNFPNTLINIGSYSFYGCVKLTGVLTIPSYLYEIQECTFYVTGFSSIVWNSVISTIGGSSFYGTPISGTLSIPSSVNSIGVGAFKSTEISSVSSLGNITKIENQTFYNCSNLTSIVNLSNITSLGAYAFYNCENLTSIQFSNELTTIGDFCFFGCTSLGSLGIEATDDIVTYLSSTYVTSIGSGAFQNCTHLIGTYYNKLTTKGGSSYLGTLSLGAAIFLNSGVVTSVDLADGLVLNSDGVTYSIANGAYSGVTALTGNVNLGNIILDDGSVATITKIGNNCFYQCTEITSVTIPSTVTSIGQYCFYGCTSLQTVELPDSVTSVGGVCFEGCSNLSTLVLSNGLTALPSQLCQQCKSLTEIVIPPTVTTIGARCFAGTGLTAISIPDSVNTIGHYSFGECNDLATVSFGEDSCLTTIDYYAFGLSGIQSIVIPSGVGKIEKNTFYRCSNLENVEFWGEITYLGDDCFGQCSNLTTLNFKLGSSSIEYIGSSAFANCSQLLLVLSLPSTVSIGTSAFTGIGSVSITYTN